MRSVVLRLVLIVLCASAVSGCDVASAIQKATSSVTDGEPNTGDGTSGHAGHDLGGGSGD